MQPPISFGMVTSSVGRNAVSDCSGWSEVLSVTESLAI